MWTIYIQNHIKSINLAVQYQLSQNISEQMQINIEGGDVGEESFFFEAIPNKVMEQKEAKEMLTKWGLFQTLTVGSFRYNQVFQEYELDRFIRDLFNSSNVRFLINNIPFKQQAIGSVQFEKLRCTELTLEIFDQLEKEDIVKKGYIAKMMSDYHEEIQICDRLRQCLLIEESQSYCIFNENQRKQFLMRLFQLLVVGGSFNQYEDMITPYLDWTKKFYKSFLSVRKRAETNEIFTESLFYEVKSMDKGKSYKKGNHPQSVLYVVINPSIRTVHVLANEWKKFW